MKPLAQVGRFFYGIPFIVFGLFHLMNGPDMAGLISGWPAATLLVYISGVALIAAGISILTRIWVKTACLLLALLLLIFILFLHIPGLSGDNMQMAMVGLLKDTALMGAALTYADILKK